jgi:hypothetical protein
VASAARLNLKEDGMFMKRPFIENQDEGRWAIVTAGRPAHQAFLPSSCTPDAGFGMCVWRARDGRPSEAFPDT